MVGLYERAGSNSILCHWDPDLQLVRVKGPPELDYVFLRRVSSPGAPMCTTRHNSVLVRCYRGCLYEFFPASQQGRFLKYPKGGIFESVCGLGNSVCIAYEGRLSVWDHRLSEAESAENLDDCPDRHGKSQIVLLDRARMLRATVQDDGKTDLSLIGGWAVSDYDVTEGGSCEDGFSCLLSMSDGCVVSGHESGAVLIWSVGSRVMVMQEMYGHEGSICALLELPDGRIVSSSEDGSVCVWG
eukprot:TRINITY_DN15613_c0_g1_i1.p1 TRINITY_DN15613_c0_g1~~TRINITY_DN15613_c0_g1_i1.p1  ORF type:complete len:242 (-),score=20.00 TRINITY_DN15613_c0_g1_i1:464-1189(-)